MQLSSQIGAARNDNAALMNSSKHNVDGTNADTLNYLFNHSSIKQIIFAINITQQIILLYNHSALYELLNTNVIFSN